MPSTNYRYKILFLEDEPVIARFVARALGIEGFQVDIAADGIIAKEKIDANNDYDLLVFDIRTPKMSGSELYEYLKRKRPELVKKIVFATGDAMNPATKEFLDRVKRPFLIKPYTPVQIKNLILETINENLSFV